MTHISNNEISVRFKVGDEFTTEDIAITREKMSCPVGKTCEIILTQFPLVVAYASTIHKLQGLTLDSMLLDASRCFSGGQLYCATSRVRRLEDLYLTGFRQESLIADERAVEFESGKIMSKRTKTE